MAKRKQKGNPNAMISMPVVNLNAAGIDAGSRGHYVCVSQDNVKEFKTHTAGLHEACKHLVLWSKDRGSRIYRILLATIIYHASGLWF